MKPITEDQVSALMHGWVEREREEIRQRAEVAGRGRTHRSAKLRLRQLARKADAISFRSMGGVFTYNGARQA